MKRQYIYPLFTILIAVLTIFAFLVSCKPDLSEYEFAGTTNFDTISLTEDLTVGDDLTVTDDMDVGGDANFGSSNLYPVGYASAGQQVVYGTEAITGTTTASHGLTTVTMCLCTLNRDPDDDAGDAAMCTTSVSSNVCTVKLWQDDFVTAATEVGVSTHWLVIGAP